MQATLLYVEQLVHNKLTRKLGAMAFVWADVRAGTSVPIG